MWYIPIIAGLAAFAVGSVWYSPVLFGNTWQKLKNIQLSYQDKKEYPRLMGTSLLAWIFTAWVTMILIQIVFSSPSALGGLVLGIILWAGFVAPTVLARTLYSKNHSRKLFFIDSGHDLVAMAVLGLVVGLLL